MKATIPSMLPSFLQTTIIRCDERVYGCDESLFVGGGERVYVWVMRVHLMVCDR